MAQNAQALGAQTQAEVENFMNQIPITRVSTSAIFGVAVGSTIKRWTKEVMYGVGCAFIFLQVLKSQGFIDIHWGVIQQKAIKAIDADGDGELTTDDLKIHFRSIIGYLSRGVPDVAGWTTGFYLGLKYF